MKKLHLLKCKNEAGWEVRDFLKSKAGERLIWAANKKICIRFASGTIKSEATKSKPVSLLIHGVDGKFKEERTYPKSADPKKTKG
jgi:hypothetical protein